MECSRVLVFLSLLKALVLSDKLTCENDWKEIENKCLQAFNETVTWNEAITKCNASEAKLVDADLFHQLGFLFDRFSYLENLGRESSFWVNASLGDKTDECPFWLTDIYFSNVALLRSCNSTIGYICQKDLNNVKRHSEFAEVQDCPKVTDLVQRGNSCYWVQEESTRDAVEEGCRVHGGHLVDIDNSDELVFLVGKMLSLNSSYWLGLKRTGDHLLWGNERTLDLSTAPWASGQPAIGSDDCVVVFHVLIGREGEETIKWTMESCNNTHPGICEINLQPPTTQTTYLQLATTPGTSTTPEPQDCPPDWNELNSGDCLWVSPAEYKQTWEQAQSFCESIGGNLLYYDEEDVPSLKEYLTSKFPRSWIGLKYNITSKEYEWSSGVSTRYRSWGTGMPNTNWMTLFCISLEPYSRQMFWVNWYCNSLQTFLCRASKSSAQPGRLPPTQEPLSSCGPEAKNWFRHEDYCYKFVSNKLRWYTAEKYCKRNGGHLASVLSNNEADFLIRMFYLMKVNQDRIWVGLNALDGEYQWTDGSVICFNNWAERKLSNFQEKCVNMYVGTALWNNENCSSKKQFLCKKYNRVTTTPTEAPSTTPLAGNCPAGWKPFGNKCYLAVGTKEQDRVGWADAQQMCISKGSQLVSVHSEEEHNFLKVLLLSLRASAWIGLHDTIIESEFYWSDNSDVDVTFWDANEPKGFFGSDDCVEMNYDLRNNYLGSWNVLECEEKKGYICQKYKDPSISTPSSEEPTCDNPKGWTKSDYGCYKIFSSTDEESSWLHAESICRRHGGHLVTIQDEGANTVLKYMSMSMRRLFWIGLKQTVENEYKWLSGMPFIYTDWGMGEPNSNVSGNACVGMSYNGQWQVSGCKERRPFACEVTSVVVPTLPTQEGGVCPGDFQGWRDFGGDNCYTIETDKLTTWPKANHHCFQQGGTLVSIHSQHEVDVLALYLMRSKNSVWLGVARRHNGGFAWTDGSPVNYVNWEDNEPSSLKEQCTEMYSDSKKWNDLPCDMQRGYICMTKKVTSKLQSLKDSEDTEF